MRILVRPQTEPVRSKSTYDFAELVSRGQEISDDEMEEIAGNEGEDADYPLESATSGEFDCWKKLKAATPRGLRYRVYATGGPKAIVYGLDTSNGWYVPLLVVPMDKDGKPPPCDNGKSYYEMSQRDDEEEEEE
jgi:hypothetical protein